MKRRRVSNSCAVALVTVGIVACGCSGPGDGLPREPVSGKVTLDGKPLPEGTIQFTSEDEKGGGVGGATIQNGQFSIPRETGLVPGNYRVAIYASGGAGGAGGGETRPASPDGSGRGRASSKPSESIPAKYNAQSELKVEIKQGGASGLKFDLQSK